MEIEIFRKLQKQLDTYSLGFPATKSGVELKILKKLFTPEDASMFLALTPLLESPEEVAEKISRSVEDVAAHLEDMAKRGLLFRLYKNNSVKYGAIPFIHGLFEFQVKRLDKNFAELINQYYKEDLKGAIIDSASGFLRTIPVQRSIDVTHNVAAYDDACELLKKMKLIVVADCICRKQKGLVDEVCDKPIEVCFLFGSMGQYYLDHDMGREVDVTEAINILTEAQKAGLVTQPATAQNPAGMCSCCGDCCGILGSINKHPKPTEIVFSNHFATLSPDKCIECGTCVDRCQTQAITTNDDLLPTINLDRCIGCGLCVITCPTESILLIPKSKNEHRVPPVKSIDQMIEMAEKRGVL